MKKKKQQASRLFRGTRPLLTFLKQLLDSPINARYISWKEQSNGIFRINDPNGLAQLWGVTRGFSNMNYEKMSRSLRHYYGSNLLKKVNIKGTQHCYQ